MIELVVDERQGRIVGFRLTGHAGYANSGSDIVCAAVSVLVINAVNSIEKFLQCAPDVTDDGNLLECRAARIADNDDAQLLLRSMVFGVEQTAATYPKHVRVIHRSDSR